MATSNYYTVYTFQSVASENAAILCELGLWKSRDVVLYRIFLLSDVHISSFCLHQTTKRSSESAKKKKHREKLIAETRRKTRRDAANRVYYRTTAPDSRTVTRV